MTELIKRTYRINKEHDKHIKKHSKKVGESGYIRRLVEKDLPNKDDARYLSKLALQNGIITKDSCEVCGEEKVDMHHLDYSDPLKIMWLCRSHHLEWHRKNEKLKGYTDRSLIFVSKNTHRMFNFAKTEFEIHNSKVSVNTFMLVLLDEVLKIAKSHRRNLHKIRKQTPK